MIPIRQSIEVQAPLITVTETWPRFVEWVLTGPRKLACDQLVCIDLARSEVVRFEDCADGRTVVAFELELPCHADGEGDNEAQDVIADKLMHDLILFKDYVEASPEAERDAARGQAEASALTRARFGRRARRDVQASDPGQPARPWTRS
jgi:hypothetical protein